MPTATQGKTVKTKADLTSQDERITPCVSTCADALIKLVESSYNYRVMCCVEDIVRAANAVGFSVRRQPRWAGHTLGELSDALEVGREESVWLVSFGPLDFEDAGHVLLIAPHGMVDTGDTPFDMPMLAAWKLRWKT